MSQTAAQRLDRSTVYRAPSGQLCRWVGAGAERAGGATFHTFEYLPQPGAGQALEMVDRVFMSEHNLRVMLVCPRP